MLMSFDQIRSIEESSQQYEFLATMLKAMYGKR